MTPCVKDMYLCDIVLNDVLGIQFEHQNGYVYKCVFMSICNITICRGTLHYNTFSLDKGRTLCHFHLQIFMDFHDWSLLQPKNISSNSLKNL
jgi:hypothetical protein